MYKHFKALGNETRLKILKLLCAQGPLIVEEIAVRTGTLASVTSGHLKTLSSVGLVRRTRDGKFVYYDVDSECVAELSRSLARLLGWDNSSEVW